MEKHILIPIARGTEEMEAVIVIDLLRRAGMNVKIAGESEIITCSRGVKLIPDLLIENIDPERIFDAIVIPGGLAGTEKLLNNDHLDTILRIHNDRGGILAAICAAPTIFTEKKLIPEKFAITSHPSVKKQIRNFKYSEAKVVVDGRYITSRGAGTAIEFALKLIEILSGKEATDKIASDIVLN